MGRKISQEGMLFVCMCVCACKNCFFLFTDIFLKSFPVQPKELKDKLFIVGEGEGGLSDEHIASLRRYKITPTPCKSITADNTYTFRYMIILVGARWLSA